MNVEIENILMPIFTLSGNTEIGWLFSRISVKVRIKSPHAIKQTTDVPFLVLLSGRYLTRPLNMSLNLMPL